MSEIEIKIKIKDKSQLIIETSESVPTIEMAYYLQWALAKFKGDNGGGLRLTVLTSTERQSVQSELGSKPIEDDFTKEVDPDFGEFKGKYMSDEDFGESKDRLGIDDYGESEN